MSVRKKYRVWWIAQMPGDAFYADVPSAEEGFRVTAILANYDLHQYEHHIKPDYCNTGGVEVFEDGEWNEVDPEEASK